MDTFSRSRLLALGIIGGRGVKRKEEMMGTKHSRFALIVAIAAALPLLTAQPALAQAVPLTGESLTGTAATNGTCPVPFGGSTTYTFDASGGSSAPYAGTFSESGSFTVLLDDESTTAFDATFTINAADGSVVTGEKHGVNSQVEGSCGFGGTAVVTTSYTASIQDPSGATTCDSGTSFVNIQGAGSATAGRFTETFTSTGTTCPPTTIGGKDKSAKEIAKTLAKCDKAGVDSDKCAKEVAKLLEKLPPEDVAMFVTMFMDMFHQPPPMMP